MNLQELVRTVLPLGIVAAILAPAAAQTTITIDPAAFADGTDISQAFPGAVLSALGTEPDTERVFTRTASSGLPGPMPVLGHDGGFPEFWFDVSFGNATLRIDFDEPADVVNVHFLMNNGFDPTFVQAFDSGGSLLDTVTTPGTSGGGNIETATIDRGGLFDIDHVVAGAQTDQDVYIRSADATALSSACLTLGFETEDDLATPLVNGQHVDTEFGNLVTITSSGSNAGIAVFDSTVGGPNDPSQDRDLLVDSGNLLILQTENFPPDGNDVFPRPNDDDDGGTLGFTLLSPREARSVRLVDFDSSDGPSSVVLSDSSGRQRTYAVPGNWTGDLTAAAPGHGTLDLTTLAPQPGFGSVATAVEDEGFDPLSVVQVDFHLGGSAAIDDLSLCSGEEVQPQASVRTRNGSGLNPSTLLATSLPVIGGTWTAQLDCTAQGPGLALLEVRRSPSSGTFTPRGELLIAGNLVLRQVRAHTGPPSPFTIRIPPDPSLAGMSLHVQGLCTATASGSRLLLFRQRFSNALDLALGF